MTGQEYIDLSKVKIRGLHEENGIHIHIEDVIRLLDDYKKQLTLTDVSQQRELLKAYAELVQDNYTHHFFDDAVEESIDRFLKNKQIK